VKHCKSAQVAQVGIEAQSITVNCTLKDDLDGAVSRPGVPLRMARTAQGENDTPE
jgi:hypothetical protein